MFNFVRPDNISVVGIVFLCKASNPKQARVDGKEHVDLRWVNEKEVEGYELAGNGKKQLDLAFKSLKTKYSD